ncbi:hypothetical protein KP509_09G040700 [Ceratopteris richardii]|nr:hypothetical protein KP509_09G040700 [Ceratopteris richardii]
MGNVLSGGLGQAPTRQAALEAGLLPSTVCTTLNKVCSSGMKAVMLAAQAIMLGTREVIVAGGMESMSNAPFLLPRIRSAKYLGDYQLIDSLMKDGLRDPLKNVPMGVFAEMCAEEMGISRGDQDAHAIRSYEKAATAQATGLFKSEIVPVTFTGERKQELTVDSDEECSKFDPDKLENLPPVFKPDGTITAGNASSISDGAAALVLTSTQFAEKHGLQILAYIRGFSDAEQAPEKFPTSPALAIPLALQQAGLHLKDINLFEINEAFSVVDLANQRLLGLSSDDVNIHGGSVSLGHPIGASGARIILSLITGLALKGLNYGVAAICNGGGGASAIVIEREKTYRLYEHEIGHKQ